MKLYREGCAAAVLIIFAAQVAAQAPSSAAQPSGTRALEAAQLKEGSIVIDGHLDEPAWANAAVATDFVQRRPNPGQPARQRTEARVVHDAGALYVGMKMYDAVDSIASQLARRDAFNIVSDWAEVIIDSYHDRRTAYVFAVNPRGVQRDLYLYDDTNGDPGWNGVWEAKTRLEQDGWTVEFRIPLSQLRFKPSDGTEQVWGIQFKRTVARTDEHTLWSPVLPTSPGYVSLFGDLHGLHGLDSPKRVEVLPYVLAQNTRVPAPTGASGNPFYRQSSFANSLGGDLKYGITSNLTVTGTINPDFGQVEADPAVVNLTAFETFFSEQRPFFLEGASIFEFTGPNQLFYSRRIGRRPQRASYSGAEFLDTEDATTIMGAAKITGRAEGGWTLGVFDAITQRESSRAQVGGNIKEFASEPLTNYAVARASRHVRGGLSNYGAILTATHRKLDDAGLRFLRSAAYSWGVNGRHRFGPDNNLAVTGFVAGSSILGDTLAIQQAQLSPVRYFQRPDAAHVEYDPRATSMHGLAAGSWIQMLGGSLTGTAGAGFRTPGFEINDLGFGPNADSWYVYGALTYNQFPSGNVLREWSVSLEPSSAYDFGGTDLNTFINVSGRAQFQNLWSGQLYASFRPTDDWSTSALRGGPAIITPAGQAVMASVDTDRRRPISFNLSVNRYDEYNSGTSRINYSGGASLRPSPQIDVSLSPSLMKYDGRWQYVGTLGIREADGTTRADTFEYVVAAMRQTQASLTVRASYTVTPELSLQIYAQPFISAGDYRTFRRVADPRASEFSERFHDFQDADLQYDDDTAMYKAALGGGTYVRFRNPDFNIRSLRSNAVIRWEYRPGSTVFVVWSSGRSGSSHGGTFDFSRDIDALFGDDATNVLLVKMNYWVNF